MTTVATDATAREKMILSQLMPGSVLSPAILGAIASVPREPFVEEKYRGLAYVDDSLPMGEGRYLMEPLTFARLIDHVDLKPTDHVLDIAPGTGYSTAVLSKLAKHVTAVEPYEALADRARPLWMKMDLLNIDLIVRPLLPDLGLRATFDVIVLEGAVREVPPYMLAALSEGGRLVAIENKALRPDAPDGLGVAVLYIKSNDNCAKRQLFDASIPLLPGFAPVPHFSFS